MKKLIGLLFGVLIFVVCASSQTPSDGAMIFSKGCSSYNYPIVFVYQNGKFHTSDFQASTKTVANWGKFDETHFYVKTTAADSFYCVILPTSYSGMGWVNKKESCSYFNGVYYNAKRDSVFLMDYSNRNAIDFFDSNISGGITISPVSYYDFEADKNIWYEHFYFGSKMLIFNRLTHDPFGNVVEIIDSINQPLSADNQWVCADKRIVSDSLDSLNYGSNFYDYNSVKGFLVTVIGDQGNYEFISVDGKRYQVPWLLQDSGNQYRNAVISSWDWEIFYAKPVSASYLAKYAINSKNIPLSYKTNKYLLKNKNFPNKKWEVVGMWGLAEISDSAAAANYGSNWSSKLVEIPDAFLADYTISGGSTQMIPSKRASRAAVQRIFGQSIVYDLMGRRIHAAQMNHAKSMGLMLVRLPNNMVVKNMNPNTNRLR